VFPHRADQTAAEGLTRCLQANGIETSLHLKIPAAGRGYCMFKPWEGALRPYHTKKVLLVFNIVKILRSGYPGPLQSSTVLMKTASSGMQPGAPAGGQWTGGLLRSWACSPGTAEQTWESTPQHPRQR